MSITFKELKKRLNRPYCQNDINKAIKEILYLRSFNFRERTHLTLAEPNKMFYPLPKCIEHIHRVSLNSVALNYEEYRIYNNNELRLMKLPDKKGVLTIDYLTNAIGFNTKGEFITKLTNGDDELTLPKHLEELFIYCLKTNLEQKIALGLFMKYSEGC